MGKTFDRYCYIVKNEIGRESYRGKHFYFINTDDAYYFFYDLERLGYASKQAILKNYERNGKDENFTDVKVAHYKMEINEQNAPHKLTLVDTIQLN